MPNDKSYEGTAGLVDDEDITITDDTKFEFNSDYNDGKTLCLAIYYEGSDDPILLSTGSGWEAKDKGARAVLEDTGEPREKGFNRSCTYFKFLKRAVELGAPLPDRGPSWEASIWHGLSFHVAREEEKNPVSGEPRDVLYPTDYLGDGDGGGKKAAPKKATTSKAAKDEDEDKAAGVPAAMKAKLKKLAKECDTHDEFIERALSEIDGVTDNEDAEALVVDEEFYTESHG